MWVQRLNLVAQVRSGPRIADRANGRTNNFDAIRFLAAIAVIISHAVPLSLGGGQPEPLTAWTHNQSTLGGVAVAVFFIVSGFLITQSYDRARDTIAFVRARLLRIVPGLITMVAVTAFVLGPIETSLSLHEYLADQRTYSYLLTVVLHNSASRTLPGVFTENAFAGVINGSVWTLEPEVLCYVVVGVLGTLGALRRDVVVGLFTTAAILSLLHLPMRPTWQSDVDLFRYFAAGMLLYVLRRYVPLDGRLAIVAGGLVGLAAITGHGFQPMLALGGSYVVLWGAFTDHVRWSRFARYGDFSYGIYIYAFPIQQAVVRAFGGAMAPIDNIVIATPLILGCAFGSWHFVEKRALRLKKQSGTVSPMVRAQPTNASISCYESSRASEGRTEATSRSAR